VAAVQVLLAAAPIAVVLAAMGVAHWSAARAGAAALACALLLSVTVFHLAEGSGLGAAQASAGVLAEAVHSTLVILWIILPALAIFEYQKATGALGRIRDLLTGLTADRRLQALLVAWFFGLFMEGTAGFGTPVALAAPLLVGLGFAPVQAVALALTGHAAAVSFGAVGTPVLTQLEITGLDPRALATATAAMHAALGWFLCLTLVRLAGDGPITRAMLGWTGFAALCFFVPFLALARFAGPELPSLGGALVGLVVFASVLRRRQIHRPPLDRRLGADLLPYALILGLVLVTRLVPPANEALTGVALRWQLHDLFTGSFQPLYHPGTLLFAGLIGGAILTGRTRTLHVAMSAALGRLWPVALALLTMLTLSRLMVHAGMIDTLANAAARIGPAWPALVPAVGVLGTFVTGSATASNILFTDFHVRTAEAIGLPATAMVAGQGFGAGIGNIVAPHNIIAGSATVGLKGGEGAVLAHTMWPCLIYTLCGGLLLFIMIPLMS
jgi:lactate permease